MTPHITHTHPLGVRFELRISSLTSSRLFPASGFEEVELMTVPLVVTATATAVGLETVAKDFETEETDWDTEGMEVLDTEWMEGFDTEGMEVLDTEGMEGFDTEGMELLDTEWMEGLDARDDRDEAAKIGAVGGFTDWHRRL